MDASARSQTVAYRGAVTDDEVMVLAGEFPPVSHDDWLAAVDKILAGRPFDRVLRTVTADGIVIEPLYTRDTEEPVADLPGPGAGRRSSTPVGPLQGWDIRQQHGWTSSPVATNDAILADLQRGVTSIELIVEGTEDRAALARLLDGVHLEMAPIGFRATTPRLGAASALLELSEARSVSGGDLVADLGCDPIGALGSGVADGGSSTALDDTIALAVHVADRYPCVRTMRADGWVYANAGASPAVELGATLATVVEYVRALTRAGLDAADALDQILCTLAVGTDQFGDLAKLRAFRVMWGRVAEVLGEPGHTCAVQAHTAPLALTQRDPWVNILRTTIGCFAAAVGGADIVTVTPFDAMVGAPDELGVRIARNTQVTLMEESNLHRVLDPAGGSWYVERLTDQLAQSAWAVFQGIEREGGVTSSLRTGSLQRTIDEQWATTAAAVATRRRPITGVSEFPDVDEAGLRRAASDGPRRSAGGGLPMRRLAAGYERLRDAADRATPPPVVFLANLGPIAIHTARATWAKNMFEAGGIRALGSDGFEDAAELAAAFRSSGAGLAVLCSSDDGYEKWAAPAAEALARAGVARLYMAGNPGDHRSRYAEAGVDEFIHVGVDVLAVLGDAHRLLGIADEEVAP